MIQKVTEFIKENSLVMKGDRIVLGVSGGADSVCLLHVLNEVAKEYMLTLVVVHVHHGIRGQEADQDEYFVKTLCDRMSISYHTFYYDVRKMAQEEGKSEEEMGRKVRYEAFSSICQLEQCNKIAIAHNSNDNAETVLFHLFRGSGITGLTGIAASRKLKSADRDIDIIRPLLCVSRTEIEAYLSEQRFEYRTDSTNLSNDYSRNKLRNQIIPLIREEINLNAVEHINQAAQQLKEIEEYITENCIIEYQKIVKKDDHNSYRILITDLQKEPVILQKGIVRKVLENLGGSLKDMEKKHVDQILSLCNKQVGKQICLPLEIVASKEYHHIRLEKNKAWDDPMDRNRDETERITINRPGYYGLQYSAKGILVSFFPYEKNNMIPKNRYTKWFDYDKIENTLEIRTRKEGDYIQINHLGGRKKLKDYFIDQKIPKEERSDIWLLADGDHILWILDDRMSDRMSEKYKIDENTNKILSIKLCDMEEKEND
ncbi:MAG: hypothetical protein K0S47_1628 [Herbinix sp.]|jgi:tRNA(Ile)-lysidine synthase|nr:hypothetical protein [Herbinix sp.]